MFPVICWFSKNGSHGNSGGLHFLDNGAFCGGIDARYLMVEGSSVDVRKRVHKVIDLFPPGLIVSPGNEAVLPDILPANIEALFKSFE